MKDLEIPGVWSQSVFTVPNVIVCGLTNNDIIIIIMMIYHMSPAATTNNEAVEIHQQPSNFQERDIL